MGRRRGSDHYGACPVWALCAECGTRVPLTEDLPEHCPACSLGSLGNRVILLPPGDGEGLPQSFLVRDPSTGRIEMRVSEETLAWLAVNVLDDAQGSERQQALLRRVLLPSEILIAREIDAAMAEIPR